MVTPKQTPATVYLVGAGPGDPGLVTLRGVECLRRAELVLYDYLVNPDILEYASDDAERVCLGRHGSGRIMPPEEIIEQMILAANDGRTVVRLKGGDPAVFARGAEEAAALAEAGIPFEIVPGITAALAAGSYAGIPVTHRELASAVTLVTGQENPDKTDSGVDFAALAATPGTLVFYMGVTTARHWTDALIAAGKQADTPSAIVRRCSLADQTTIYCTLGTLAERMKTAGVRPPALAIIGPVVSLGPTLDWFSKRPLFGTRVLITRPRDQAAALAGPLAELGADVLRQPVIEIGPPGDLAAVDAAVSRLGEFDWIVFSSANGVERLLGRLMAGSGDLRALGGVKIAAIGPATAKRLADYHLKCDVHPADYRAEALAAALAPDAAGKRFLLARASRGREVLAEQLTAAGGNVEQVVVYSSTDITAAKPEVAEAMSRGRIDWVTVTSSAIARSLVSLFGEQLRACRLASISPITSETLRDLGHDVAVEAEEYTGAGLVEAIRQAAG
jgi:uroporphyrinogen III methyltransferase/synthase